MVKSEYGEIYGQINLSCNEYKLLEVRLDQNVTEISNSLAELQKMVQRFEGVERNDFLQPLILKQESLQL
jgi:hypothetical protein